MAAIKYKGELTEAERSRLNEVSQRGKASVRTVKRALSLLKADQGLRDREIADVLLVNAATASVSARPNQGSALDTPDQPVGTAVFVGGVDLEWNDVPGADSYDVQLYRNGQWTDLPGDGVEIAFYGAGAIISELDPSSTHWFQVRARNVHGSSDWSDYRQVGSTRAKLRWANGPSRTTLRPVARRSSMARRRSERASPPMRRE